MNDEEINEKDVLYLYETMARIYLDETLSPEERSSRLFNICFLEFSKLRKTLSKHEEMLSNSSISTHNGALKSETVSTFTVTFNNKT